MRRSIVIATALALLTTASLSQSIAPLPPIPGSIPLGGGKWQVAVASVEVAPDGAVAGIAIGTSDPGCQIAMVYQVWGGTPIVVDIRCAGAVGCVTRNCAKKSQPLPNGNTQMWCECQ